MKHLITLFFVFAVVFGSVQAQRTVENLSRGVVAVRSNSKTVFVSWRLLPHDPSDIGFNIYRSTAGATPVKLNATVLTAGTNYEDSGADLTKENSYMVRPVINGIEVQTSKAFSLSANHAYEPCVVVPLRAGSLIHFVWVGDLTGDGEYDYVVDRLDWTNSNCKIEAYKSDGTFLWQLDYGKNSTNMDNISPGSSTIDVGMWDGVTVYDINNDGKAEVITKIANGVKFGDGNSWTNSSDTKQWIAVLNGQTGALMNYCAVPTDYLAVGPLACQLGIGYLDGASPSIVARFKNRNADKSFNAMICAFKMSGSNLVMQWKWKRENQACPDFHQMRIVDVDQDGKDDVCDGGYVLKHDGTLRYSLDPAGIVHGDRYHIGKLDPNRAGLQGYGIQQENPNGLHDYYYDAGTGKMIWQHKGAVGDLARGMAADVDPNNAGYEVWTFDGLYNAPSNKLLNTSFLYPSLRFWWDGDDLSESYNDGKIEKWNYTAGNVGRVLTTWNFHGASSSDRGAPMFYGDIMGDWREEAILTTSDYSALVIFTTNVPTTRRLYSLSYNPEYRNCMTVKGYYQSNMLDYFLGAGMTTPATPNVAYWQTLVLSLTSPTNNASFNLGAAINLAATVSTTKATITKVDFYDGTTLLSSDNTAPYSFSWTNATVGKHTISAIATGSTGILSNMATATVTVSSITPVTYVYNVDSFDVWTNTARWSPASLPTSNDTAIIRTGEAKIGQDYAGYVKVEPNGILRAMAFTNLATVALQGGAIKVNTSNQTYGMKADFVVKVASSVISGSNTATLFTIDGTIAGSANLTKKDLGVVKVTASATNFKGMWVVENDTLTIASASGLGLCGAVVDVAVLDIDVATSANAVTVKKGGKLNLDANLSVQAAVFDQINLAAGTYSASDFPAFISGSGKLVVGKSLVTNTTSGSTITLAASAGASYSWSNGTAEVATTAAFTPSVSGLYSVKATAANGCAISSAVIQVTLPIKQNISLVKGWNLISINLHPADSSIATLFNGLDVQEIKTMDAFWRKGQSDAFNGLQKLTTGEGYLVNMNSAGTLTVTGAQNLQGFKNLEGLGTGWHLIGCLYQTATSFSTNFNATNCAVIKNFDGFWIPNGTSNSIQNLEPGKGYYLKR